LWFSEQNSQGEVGHKDHGQEVLTWSREVDGGSEIIFGAYEWFEKRLRDPGWEIW
jgi:hypothetical protein